MFDCVSRWTWRRRGSSVSVVSDYGMDYRTIEVTLTTQMGVSGQRHALAALYPRGMDPWYPLYRRLGGPQSWSGYRG
jgi:hypothetical protein